MAVERVREGARRATSSLAMAFTAARSIAGSRRREDVATDFSRSRPAPRPDSRTLTARQERQVLHWVHRKNPRQCGFGFGLWTRQIVRELMVQRFGARLSLASIGSLLAC